jgi:hypothetical protein
MDFAALPTSRRLVSAVFVFGFLALPPARASDVTGFLEPVGRGAAVLAFTTEGYDEFWMGRTKVADPGLGRVRTNSTTFFMQFGLTERATLVANLPYVNTRGDGQAGFAESGLQDIAALLKVRVAGFGSRTRSSFVLAGGVRTIASNYEANKPVAVGDGTADGLLRIVHLLQAGPFYWSQQVGLDLRGGEAPNGFPVYSEVGWSLGQATLSLLYTGYWADGGSDIGDAGFTFPSNKDETQRVGVKAYVRLSETWGVVGHGFTTLSGRNSGDASGVGAGLVVRY